MDPQRPGARRNRATKSWKWRIYAFWALIFASYAAMFLSGGVPGYWLFALLPITLGAAVANVVAAILVHRRAFAKPRAETLADPLLNQSVQWIPISEHGGRYIARADGVLWELQIDESNQGTRYIIKTGGRFVREVDRPPSGWELRASDNMTEADGEAWL